VHRFHVPELGSLTGKFENLVAFLTQADALEQEAVLLAL
jgi:hypothetical protein